MPVKLNFVMIPNFMRKDFTCGALWLSGPKCVIFKISKFRPAELGASSLQQDIFVSWGGGNTILITIIGLLKKAKLKQCIHQGKNRTFTAAYTFTTQGKTLQNKESKNKKQF